MQDWGEEYSGDKTYYVVMRPGHVIKVLEQPPSPLEIGVIEVFKDVNLKMLTILREIECDPSQSSSALCGSNIKEHVKAKIAYLKELERQTQRIYAPVGRVKHARR